MARATIHAKVSAMVSLDTTLEYTPEDYDGHRFLRDRSRGPTMEIVEHKGIEIFFGKDET